MSHGCGVAVVGRRSSNVHGAAGAVPAGKQPTMRRSVPAPLSGGLFVKYFQFGWSAGGVEPVDAAQHGAGLGVDEHGPGRGTRPLSTTLASKARRKPPPVGTATSRTCWSWASPPTPSWPKPARAPRTDTAPALDAGVAGRGPPGLLAGQAPRALRASPRPPSDEDA